MILALFGTVLLVAAPAAAPPDVPRRTSTATVFGDDPCPTPPDGEIVVCGRLPESERYRIPKKLRENKKARVEQNWASRNATLDELARTQRPNSCSVVGSGGQTGCTAQMLRQWADERRAAGYQVGTPF